MSDRVHSIEHRRSARWGLLLLFIVMPVVNFSGAFWPGGENRFTDDPKTRIEAAGYAFSIWFVIFTGMIAFSVHVLKNEPWTRSLKNAIVCLAIAGIASTVFVPISIYGNSVLGWIDIAAHLVPLVLANLALRRHVVETKPCRGRWIFFAPSMYLGWISAAFLIICGMAANELGLELPDATATAVTCCAIGAVTTIALLVLREHDPVYAGTIAWALVAVGVKQAEFLPIRATAWIAAATLVIVIAVWKAQGNRFYAVRASGAKSVDDG